MLNNYIISGLYFELQCYLIKKWHNMKSDSSHFAKMSSNFGENKKQ